MAMTIAVDQNSPPPAQAICHTKIRRAIEAFTDAKRTALEAKRNAIALEQARPRIEREDAQQLADQIAKGGKETGPRLLEQHDRELAAARRRQAALAELENRALRSLEAALAAHAGEWQAQVQEQHQELLVAKDTAVNELAAAHQRLATVQAAYSWLQEGGGRWRANARYLSVVPMPFVHDFDRIDVGDLLAALRDLGHPKPEPPEQGPPSLRTAHVTTSALTG